MPYIRKYGKHPVTGAPLKLDQLIPLTFHKNTEGMTCIELCHSDADLKSILSCWVFNCTPLSYSEL